MTVSIMKTKAEEGLTEAFGAVESRLPGGNSVRARRRSAIDVFETLGLPHRRIEEWKYTDLRGLMKENLAPAVGEKASVKAAEIEAALGALAALDTHRVVFVNGALNAELSRFSGVKGLEIKSLGETLSEAQEKVVANLLPVPRDDDALAALNTAFATDGAVMRVADGAEIDRPILLVFARTGKDETAITTRNVVKIGDGAKVTLIEAFVSVAGAAANGQSNAATEIVVGKAAAVTHVKATLDAGKAVHLASCTAEIAAEANYRAFQLTAGIALTRTNIFVTFTGEDAKLDCSGAFLARGNEHVDTTLVVDHAVPGCESRELYKGVLDGHGRGIFQGKVIVRPDAQKTDGKQMAQVLMLSPDCEFDSKPELEIYADDVVCGHGSTSAEIDPDLIFYCMSRGIPEAEARALLIESFIGEAIEKVEDEPVREALMTIAAQLLNQRTA